MENISYLPALRNTWFFHKRWPFCLECNRSPSPPVMDHDTGMPVHTDHEVLKIVCFGRSVSPIKELFAACRAFAKDQKETFVIVRSSSGSHYSWGQKLLMPIRPMDTIHLDEIIKSKILSDEQRSTETCTLSGLLNVLDGVASKEGRMVITTANKPEGLDEALIRRGHIDKEVYLGTHIHGRCTADVHEDDHTGDRDRGTAICRFSEPIAFNSILAYTYVMVRDLNGGDDTDASFYAGLLVSAYAVAEALTAMGWGALSDRYGRKPIVLLGLGGVAISSLIFGLATKYWVALLARFVGGALNGNVAVMQTMVAEMVKNPDHEPTAYASQPFVWTLGGIIGSAMGGFLAQPAQFYPSLFPADGIFGRYPYLLPNLVSVVVIVLAIIQGIFFLGETNPREKKTIEEHAVEDDVADERTPLRNPRRSRSALSHQSERPRFMEESLPVPVEQNFDLRRTSFGTLHSIKLPTELQSDRPKPRAETFKGPAFNYTVIMITIALLLVSYHQMAFCTLLPTHLLDKPAAPHGHLDLRGGLGFTVHDVGTYLAVNGVLGLLIQGFIFPIFVEKVRS
ncbi:hypothetical protein DL771_004424 [Monosporascus sp. 5C6A]|nr:hypothetical protein DL771_004424 [Monosporascus sp. 5C6A]